MYVIALAHSTIFLQFSTLSPCSPCLCIELWQKRSVWCQISLGRDLQRGFNMFRSNNYVQIIQCSGHSVACQRLLLQTLMAKGVPTTTNVYKCGITWLVLGQSWALHSINVSSMYSMNFHECSMTFQCTIIGLLGLVQVLTSLDAFWSIDALMLPQAPTAQLLQLLQLHLNYARTHLTSSDPQFFCVGKGQVVCYGLLVCHFTALVSSSSLMKREAAWCNTNITTYCITTYHNNKLAKAETPKSSIFLRKLYEKTKKKRTASGETWDNLLQTGRKCWIAGLGCQAFAKLHAAAWTPFDPMDIR